MKSRRIKIAAVAVLAAAVMLPVGYGAVKAVMKHFVFPTDKATFEYPEPNGGVTAYGVGGAVGVMTSDDTTEDEARARLEEFYQLYREGKAREVRPGVWEATLSNGEVMGFGGDPSKAMGGFTAEDKERMKKQFDEINELRKAGKGERTFLKEVEENGVRLRLYTVRYTLSNGEVVSVGEGEPAP